jgi:hypothetical protein
MKTAFSNELTEDAENGFFRWIEWGRLFQLDWLGWLRTTFSAGLNGDDFFDWVEWGRLCRLD